MTTWFEKYRVVPRILLVSCLALMIQVTELLLSWMLNLDPTHLSDVQYAAALAAPSALMGIYTKLFLDFYRHYSDTGKELQQS